ncbi:FMN-binding protein [Clostridium sp. Cult2]|uniref:FMN-binding protein n=1 Tax=Clostridium sp. Cult2 TaxID=2079003 RepID=UPI001F031944|nr:FMN-binding protein [Clostridium sp. Cult2]MCF6464991.1 NADH:quinone oxidoreductase [Clostridium sp. Cult2]
MKKSFSFPIVFMVIITAIFTLILAYLNYVTTDAIAFNEETDLRKTLLYVFHIDLPSEDPMIIEEVFNKYVDKEEIGDETIYFIKENEETIGYAFPVGGTALWGTVQGYVAVTEDFSQLLGIDFVSHSETPGLGGRISENWFKEQFRGLDLTEAKDGQYIIYRPAPDGNVDGIAGATQTTNSVGKFLNEDIHEFISKMREGK